jgi:hypothetical protein
MKTNIIFFIISRSFLLRMRNVSNTSCRENPNPYFMISKSFFFCRDVYEVMWKTTVERGRSQMAIWRMLIACWILNATNVHTVRLRNKSVFPLHQSLHESVSMLRHTYVLCWFSVVLTSLAIKEHLTLLLPLPRISPPHLESFKIRETDCIL